MKLKINASVRFRSNFTNKPTDLNGQEIFRITQVIEQDPWYHNYYEITNNKGMFWLVTEQSITGALKVESIINKLIKN